MRMEIWGEGGGNWPPKNFRFPLSTMRNFNPPAPLATTRFKYDSNST